MDEPDAQDKQVLGARLSDISEQEAELHDGLHLEVPEDEQKRRAEWLKLPLRRERRCGGFTHCCCINRRLS